MDAREIAAALVCAMSHDVDVPFAPSEPQWVALVSGVQRLLNAGAMFDKVRIDLLATGDTDSAADAFVEYDGYDETHDALEDIFSSFDGELATPFQCAVCSGAAAAP